MRRKIDSLLEEQVRPGLAAHGGNVEVIDVDNDQVFLKLTGGCHGCSASSATLKQGIEKVIKQNFPEIKDVIDLTDHKSGENPYM
tara:strand:+ start:1124 stop:1378 length:255 start_codon:yes stop_codon:yes gene_type:complete